MNTRFPRGLSAPHGRAEPTKMETADGPRESGEPPGGHRAQLRHRCAHRPPYLAAEPLGPTASSGSKTQAQVGPASHLFRTFAPWSEDGPLPHLSHLQLSS
ncbi:hypothetical protein P7K49_021222 [Saguinus oedipus]|uniref:Uncharacterized protein n=1 Tax=Saguinus oedipus TaxID=9490 RepID=A0ABQ9US30_SAGOE|nr:hypothetical protein P7K49_021222 [Saguinus oedipus]